MDPREAELRREVLLREQVDRAYALARREVFDVEGPNPDPALRTPHQREVLVALEAAEQELRDCRRRLHG